MKKHSNDEDTKQHMDGIKQDIESLTRRLQSIKGHGSEIMLDQLDNLSDVISNMKDKAVTVERDSLASLCFSTRKNPVRNLFYAFGAGLIAAYLMRK